MLFLALSQVSPTTSRCLSLKGLEDRKYNKFYPLSYNIELHSRGRNYGFDLKEEANCSPMVKSEFKISKWRLPNAKYAFDISSWCNVVYWRLRRKSRSKRLNEFFSSMTWGLVLLEWTTRSVLRQIYITLDEIVSNTLQIFSLSLSLSLYSIYTRISDLSIDCPIDRQIVSSSSSLRSKGNVFPREIEQKLVTLSADEFTPLATSVLRGSPNSKAIRSSVWINTLNCHVARSGEGKKEAIAGGW